MRPLTYHDRRFRGLYADERHDLPDGFLRELTNCYIDNGRIRGRPGFRNVEIDMNGDGSRIQGVCHYEESDGTPHTVAVCGGSLYEMDWNLEGAGWTELSGLGTDLNPTALVRMVEFNGDLIITDGINEPILWDGASYTVLTAAPVSSQMTVYYEKLFFVDQSAEPNVIAWSDEGDATSGYAADQQWQFGQTDQGRIVGAQGLNEALLIFKEDAISRIQGAVDDNFQTEAVREGISTTEGTVNGDSIVVVDEDVYFISPNGPRLVRSANTRPIDIAEAPDGGNFLYDIWQNMQKENLLIERAQGVHDPVRDHIIWAIDLTEQGHSTVVVDRFMIVYSIKNGSFQIFRGFDALRMALVEASPPIANENANYTRGQSLIMFGDEGGYVYLYGDIQTEHDWNDPSTPTTMNRLVETRDYGGGSDFVNKMFRYIDLGLYPDGGVTLNITPIPDNQPGRTRETIITGSNQERFTRGVREFGGKMRVRIQQQALDETLDLMDIIVRGSAYSAEHQHGAQT